MVNRPATVSYPFIVSNLKGTMATSGSGANTKLNQPVFAHETYPITVSFTDNSYQRKYRKEVEWDFGDGTKVRGYSATHYYRFPGKYKITCTFFDINRLGERNSYVVTAIVKGILPSKLSFVVGESSVESIKCSAITKIARIEACLSDNVLEDVPILAQRIYGKAEKEESSWDDIKESIYPHLEKYWTFLQWEYEYDPQNETPYKERYGPTHEYMPEYERMYGYFDKSLVFHCYRLQPYKNVAAMPDIQINDPNGSIVNNETFITCKVNNVTLESELPADAKFIGRRAFVDIFYRSDFLSSNNTVSFSFEQDKYKISNSIESAQYFLNIPPVGLHFSVVKNTASDVKYSLSLNGFITSFEPVDKLVQLSLIKDYSFNCFIVPYVLSQYNNYYIPKDIDFAQTSINVVHGTDSDSIIQDRSKELFNGKPVPSFLRVLNIICKETLNVTLQVPSYANIVLKYDLKDFDKLTIPSEKYYDQDVTRLVNTYTPHVMFQSTPRLKKALVDFFQNGNFLNYIVTKGIHFFDDTTNYKTNYISFLIQMLHMMNVDAYEYDQTLLDGVNELRDFVRILSMNHTDLMGNYVNETYDIKVRPLYKGKHISDSLLVTDRIFLDEQSKVVQIERDGKTYKIADPNEYIVAVDNYTYASKMVNFMGWKMDTDEVNKLVSALNSATLNKVANAAIAKVKSVSERLTPVNIEQPLTESDVIPEDLQYPVYLSLWEGNTKFAVSYNAVKITNLPGKQMIWSFEDQDIHPSGHNLTPKWLVDPTDNWNGNNYVQNWFTIGTWYNSQRNWGLLLPDNVYDVPQDTPKIIESYYSFYLLHPNSEKVYISNFLDEKTITAEMLDREKWNEEYGCTFDILEKIIFDALVLREKSEVTSE